MARRSIRYDGESFDCTKYIRRNHGQKLLHEKEE